MSRRGLGSRDDYTAAETAVIVAGATLAIRVQENPLLLAGVLIAVWLALTLCARIERRRPARRAKVPR